MSSSPLRSHVSDGIDALRRESVQAPRVQRFAFTPTARNAAAMIEAKQFEKAT